MHTGTPDLIEAARREGPGSAQHAEFHALEYWCTTTTKGSVHGFKQYLSKVHAGAARKFANKGKKGGSCLYRRHYHQVRSQRGGGGGAYAAFVQCFQFPNPRQPQVRTKVTGLSHCGTRRATRSIMDVSPLRLQCNGIGAGLQRRNNNQSVAAGVVHLSGGYQKKKHIRLQSAGIIVPLFLSLLSTQGLHTHAGGTARMEFLLCTTMAGRMRTRSWPPPPPPPPGLETLHYSRY